MLAKSKLIRIERKISEPLINNQNSHEEFATIVNEERNYWELKESDTETNKKITWLKKVKEKALMKLLEKMHKYKTMLSYCLKCKKKYTKHKSKSFKN